jgi:hypothetical protein
MSFWVDNCVRQISEQPNMHTFQLCDIVFTIVLGNPKEIGATKDPDSLRCGHFATKGSMHNMWTQKKQSAMPLPLFFHQ